MSLEEEEIEQARHQRRDEDHDQKRETSLTFLEERPQEKNQCEVAEKVLPACVPSDVRKEGNIVAKVVEMRAHDNVLLERVAQDVHAHCYEGEGQHHGGVVGDLESLHLQNTIAAAGPRASPCPYADLVRSL